MEFLAGLVVIVSLILCLGASGNLIAIIAASVGILAVILSWCFFIVSLIFLLCSEKKKAYFVRFEKGKHKFDCAVYEIDGKEYRNAFPAESAMRNNIYIAGKEVTVRLFKRNGSVYDKNSVITIIAGIISFTLIAAGIPVLINEIFG